MTDASDNKFHSSHITSGPKSTLLSVPWLSLAKPMLTCRHCFSLFHPSQQCEFAPNPTSLQHIRQVLLIADQSAICGITNLHNPAHTHTVVLSMYAISVLITQQQRISITKQSFAHTVLPIGQHPSASDYSKTKAAVSMRKIPFNPTPSYII